MNASRPFTSAKPGMFPGFVFCLAAGLCLAAAVQAEPTLQEGRLLFQSLCVQCHGTQAGGHEQLKVPAIAGLPDWYVLGQFQHFDQGRRGTVADGPQAMVMAATLKAISEAQRRAIAAYVESLPRQVPAPDPAPALEADTNEGRLLFQERCMECHRYNATGEQVFGSPPLLGFQAWYLRSQLLKFQSGARGAASPKDANGLKMALASRYAETRQDVENVVAYVLSLNQPALAAPVEASPFESAGAP